MEEIKFRVHENEKLFLAIKIVLSLFFYLLIAIGVAFLFSDEDTSSYRGIIVIILYLILIGLYMLVRHGILLGYIKGNAIKITKKQFPDIYKIVEEQSSKLGLYRIPTVYILQSGGILNAFAANLSGKNYVVLYSEMVETAYEQDTNILEFIIGHEMGHIKRNHMFKNLFLWPANIFPLLGPAYSRACEYTCDNIGYALAPKGLLGGMLLLASGRGIYKNVNVEEYLNQATDREGFWKWFAEKTSSHPNLSKRIAVYQHEISFKPAEKPKKVNVEEETGGDHSRFMPR